MAGADQEVRPPADGEPGGGMVLKTTGKQNLSHSPLTQWFTQPFISKPLVNNH